MRSLRIAGVGLMSLLLGAAPPTSTAVGATESGPRGVVVNPETNMVYAITSSKDTVTAIDGSTGAATAIKVGSGPKAVAVNPVTNRAYVINELSGSMSVIDGATNRVMATVDVGATPSSIALNPVTNKIYVARSYGNGLITVVDGATNQPARN